MAMVVVMVVEMEEGGWEPVVAALVLLDRGGAASEHELPGRTRDQGPPGSGAGERLRSASG